MSIIGTWEGVETRAFNQSVKRNGNFFLESEIFLLEKHEFENWKSQFVTSNSEKMGLRKLPNFFTKTGIEKLALIFKSLSVLDIHEKILDAFKMSNTELVFPNSELKNEVLSYVSEDGTIKFDVKIEDETVWLTQQQIADLFDTTQQNISFHLTNIFDEKELEKNSVHKYYLYTGADGKQYKTLHYNLDAILSIGYRVNTKKGTHFRQWSTKVLTSHLLKGWTKKEHASNIQVLDAFNHFKELMIEKMKRFESEIETVKMSQKIEGTLVVDKFNLIISHNKCKTVRFFGKLIR